MLITLVYLANERLLTIFYCACPSPLTALYCFQKSLHEIKKFLSKPCFCLMFLVLQDFKSTGRELRYLFMIYNQTVSTLFLRLCKCTCNVLMLDGSHYIINASSKTEQAHRLDGAFAVCICNQYPNRMNYLCSTELSLSAYVISAQIT